MSRNHTDVMQLYRIASMYYQEGLTQKQIAAEENISRSQISRLLEQARAAGVVEISVRMPEKISLSELKRDLVSRLRLRDAVIAPLAEGAGGDEAIDAVATAAAAYLPRELKGCRTVGVGWGRTVYRMSCVLSHRTAEAEVTFVPLVGASGTDNPALQVNAIIDRMGERFRAHTYFISAPAFRESSDAPLPELETKRLRRLRRYWKELDAAVIGIGAAPDVRRFFVSEVSPRFASQLRENGAVGDVLSQFYREDGSLVPEAPGYERTVFDAEALRRVPKVICLAGGAGKASSLVAAARAGYYNTLVTDSVTAGAIYETLRS